MANHAQGFIGKLLLKILGKPKDVHDVSVFHKISLVPLLAWIGLGADGLSSSAYGPEEAFKALGGHVYLAVFLGLGTALTVFIISYAYSRIIERFPFGGGGYIVATQMLGEKAGVISGCALLVDYVLTISISIASCVDAIFSFLPIEFHSLKIFIIVLFVLFLIVLNLRGVKESILVLAPIFLTFVFTHALLILYGILSNAGAITPLSRGVYVDFTSNLSAMGGLAMFLIFIRAYSLGGGTYTGIEAVSNGLQIMREPRVKTGKWTMIYMASSLAFTAMGLFICYLLFDVRHVEGRTLNAVLADSVFRSWTFSGPIAFTTILSEGALLLVAAQTGFIDGPRVMANMAVDSWFPHRFSALSERLTTQNGIFVMGISALLVLLYTGASVSTLVIMYSINVFITFSLSQFGMSRFFVRHRGHEKNWLRHLSVHLAGLTLCLTILLITVYEKFAEGGWITLLITFIIVILCYSIRLHYDTVKKELEQFDRYLKNIPTAGVMNLEPLNPKNSTAIQLVDDFNGFGVHTFLSIIRNFPHLYKNYIFVSIAVIGSGTFKGSEEINRLEESVKGSLEKYVELARKLGVPADYRYSTGTDVVDEAVRLCNSLRREFPESTVFTGQLTFRLEKFYHKMLHNETAFAIQRRLQWDGITTVILPIRIDV